MGKSRLIILFISLLYYNLSLSQNTVFDSIFWYKADFDIMRDSITFKPYYKIVKVYPEVLSGTEQDYLKSQKTGMQNGQIAIGPFKEKKSVALSSHYYTNLNIDFVIPNENLSNEYYWYSVAVNKSIKNNGLDFTQTSRAVGLGSMNDFIAILFEELENMNLIIGPFTNQTEAEFSKSLNSWLVPKHRQENTYRYKPSYMDKYIDYETLYWFTLKLDTKPDSAWQYMINEVKPEIIWGTSIKYVEYQKEQMKNGFVCVGPFEDWQVALIAKSAYTKFNDFTERDTSCYSEYFYYVSQIKTLKKNGSKEFNRAPAAVASGSFLDFKMSLFEGLDIKHFIIGPFVTQENAEESKRLNRMLEPKHPRKNKYKD